MHYFIQQFILNELNGKSNKNESPLNFWLKFKMLKLVFYLMNTFVYNFNCVEQFQPILLHVPLIFLESNPIMRMNKQFSGSLRLTVPLWTYVKFSFQSVRTSYGSRIPEDTCGKKGVVSEFAMPVKLTFSPARHRGQRKECEKGKQNGFSCR